MALQIWMYYFVLAAVFDTDGEILERYKCNIVTGNQ